MMSPGDQIPISLVGHYAFCPRRAWLEAVGERSSAAQVEMGTRDHRRVDDPTTSRSDELRSVDIFHDSWGVTGRLDALKVDGNEVSIREYKATPVRRTTSVTEPMRTQLALQSACLKSMGTEVVKTEIYFTTHNRVVEVELGQDDYDRAELLVKQTRECISSDAAPEPLEDMPQCAHCSHAGVCLPDERRLEPNARRVMVADPDAQIVHLTTPGTRGRVQAGQLIVEKSGEELARIPLNMVQGLQVHGNVDLSSALIRELLWRGINIVWCSGTGRFYGWAQSSYGPNGLGRAQQHVASSEGRLGLAREFISCKIANQATQLRRAGDLEETVTRLRQLQRKCRNADTWQAILGLEGEAASLYFSQWPHLLKPRERERWAWSGRTGRPATDAINALLNYGYSMLTSDGVKALISCGLDPHAGFLHSSSRNKPALALDLIEEFRAPVVDSVVQTVINNGEIQPSQFSTTFGTCRMDDRARKSLVAAYERRMATEFKHPIFGYSVTWRRALEVQARQVLGVIDGS